MEFNEKPSYMKGVLAERILIDRVLPEIYDIKVQFKAPDESHPFDFIFNIGNTIFAGECKCTSMLATRDAYAIKNSQHEKYVQIEKKRPGLFILFFVDPYLSVIFIASLKDLVSNCEKIKTVNSKMVAYPVKNMFRLDYEIPASDCDAMLAYDKHMKTYSYSKNMRPVNKGVIDEANLILNIT